MKPTEPVVEEEARGTVPLVLEDALERQVLIAVQAPLALGPSVATAKVGYLQAQSVALAWVRLIRALPVTAAEKLGWSTAQCICSRTKCALPG